jgi:hypothetical protein
MLCVPPQTDLCDTVKAENTTMTEDEVNSQVYSSWKSVNPPVSECLQLSDACVDVCRLRDHFWSVWTSLLYLITDLNKRVVTMAVSAIKASYSVPGLMDVFSGALLSCASVRNCRRLSERSSVKLIHPPTRLGTRSCSSRSLTESSTKPSVYIPRRRRLLKSYVPLSTTLMILLKSSGGGRQHSPAQHARHVSRRNRHRQTPHPCRNQGCSTYRRCESHAFPVGR